MKKLFIVCSLLLVSALGQAQVLSTSATVTDGTGQAWIGGTYSIVPLQSGYNYNGTPLSMVPITGTLDGTGSFSGVSLYTTTTLAPVTAQYTFTICSKTSAPCSVFNSPVTTANLTSLIDGNIIALKFNASTTAFGYSDAEVITPISIGTGYFNVLTNVQRIWNGTSWQNGSGGSVVGTGSVGVTTANGITTVAGSDSLPSAIRSVGTRTGLESSNSGSNTWIMTNSYVGIKSPIPTGQSLNFTFRNTIYTASGLVNPGTATFKMSVQYPALTGTIYPCYSGGNQQVTVAGNADFNTSCILPFDLPSNIILGYRLLEVNTTGAIYTINFPYLAGTQFTQFGTGTPNDAVNGGTVIDSIPNLYVSVPPIAVTSLSTKDSFLLLGDSRLCGVYVIPALSNSTNGEIVPNISQYYGNTNTCIPGVSAQFLASTILPTLTEFFPLATKVFDESAVNDAVQNGSSPTQIIGFKQSIASLFTVPVYWSTVPSVTSSSDGFTTLANQTIFYDARPLNNLIRQAYYYGVRGYSDIAAAIDPPNLGKWSVNADGTARTADGTHENNSGANVEFYSGVVNIPSLIASTNFGAVQGLPCTTAGVSGCAPVVATSGRGTLTCTVGGSITVTNTNVQATSLISFSLNTAGGTITGLPYPTTITPATSFVVKCGAADTSVYNYAIAN